LKFTKNNQQVFFRLLLLSLLIGTLAWDLLERLIALTGFILDLAVGPVGFDIHVLAVSLYLNPGTLLGCLAGWILFRRL